MKLIFENKKGFVVGELHYSVDKGNIFFHDNSEQDAVTNLVRIFDDMKDKEYCYIVSENVRDFGKENMHVFNSIPDIFEYLKDKEEFTIKGLLGSYDTIKNGEDCYLGDYLIERRFID